MQLHMLPNGYKIAIEMMTDAPRPTSQDAGRGFQRVHLGVEAGQISL